MSSEPAVSVERVSKVYRIYDHPQDRLKDALFGRFGRSWGRSFNALQHVSFELARGQTLGILGANGAGKSTLLQIIAGTLAPTSGAVRTSGRVAALLELGSGFNPEFTGRENVRLNATILGLSPREIATRMDDILAFADIGAFVDVPVKTYSSGMLMRLAFAVQAHIEPDVLIVDEALSVGDVFFQHKCMRRIRELLDRGTTLLYVSHSTDTVKRLCNLALWLDRGEQRGFGEAGITVEKYLADMRMREAQEWIAETHLLAQERDAASEAIGADVIGPGATAAPALARVSSSIDLSNEALFTAGRWTYGNGGGPNGASETAANGAALGRLSRVTEDPHAEAAFLTAATEVTLTFGRGGRVGDAIVTIDGVDRTVELARPGPTEPATVRFALAEGEGEHLVAIRPSRERASSQGPLVWLGGSVQRTPPLAFEREATFGAGTSAVERYGTGKVRLTGVQLLDWQTGQPLSEVEFGQRVRLRAHAERLDDLRGRLEFSFIVRDRNRMDLFGTTTIDEGLRLDAAARQFVIEFEFDVLVGPGSYSILCAVVECSEDLKVRVPLDQVDIAYIFTVGFNPLRPVWYVFHTPYVARAAQR
jgi:ABC-type polysaccharide/polyol phosphate transport system ATPase subunit